MKTFPTVWNGRSAMPAESLSLISPWNRTITPFVHWLPTSMRRRMLPWTTWGILTKATNAEMYAMIQEIRPIPRAELKRMFPDGQIRVERFIGLPKSLIAHRRES
jgi:hypothetical protein